MAQTSNPDRASPAPTRDANAPVPVPTDAELKERTDKEIAERVSSAPPTPTPTQEEADAIKEGRYDASAPAGQRVKKSMEPQSGAGYTTR